MSITYNDGPNEGFNDPTLGPARRAAFEHTVDIWKVQLRGDIPVRVRAAFDPLGGTPVSAPLGQASPGAVVRDHDNAPLAGTWFVKALANQQAGEELAGGIFDITTTFNSDVDGPTVLGITTFYYGFDANPGPNKIDFVTVALHELGHGLGFTTQMNKDTGAWFNGFPDIYARQLRRPGVGDYETMTVQQREEANISDNVFWKGANAVAAKGALVKIYAPDPVKGASSISHWDPSNSPDLLMEPSYIGPHHSIDLTKQAFQDIFWIFNQKPVANDNSAVTNPNTPVDIDVLVNDTDPDGDAITIHSFTQGSNGTVANPSPGILRYDPVQDFTGDDTFTYVIRDSNGETSDPASVFVTVLETPNAARHWLLY